MRTYRESRLARAIDDKRRPRCKTPGCVFRLPICPIHAVEHESPEHHAFEAELTANGRNGGIR